jgi:hypothetical protein
MIPQRLSSLPVALAGAVVFLASAAAAPPATSPTSGAPHRVEILGLEGRPFPYTIELPAGWEMSRGKDSPAVFLAPAGLTAPETDPRVIMVRVSPASLADPAGVVANIKKSQPADGSWSTPVLEVHEVAGVHAVLVRMDSGVGDQARSTLVLKLPFGQSSIDLMASAPRAEFERQLAGYRRVLFSIQPVR